VHQQPEGYGHEPRPNQPQGPGYPPQQPYGTPPPYGGAPQPPPGGGPPWGPAPQPGGWGPQDPAGPGGWGPPPPGPPRKGSSGPIIAVAAVSALLLLGGGGAIAWALSDNGHKPSHPVAASTRPVVSPAYPDPSDLPSVPAFPTPSVPDFPTPTGSPTADESMFVQAGDCVRITGKTPHVKMFKTDCDGAPYKVLKRFSGTSDKNKCRSVHGYTTAFWAKSKKYGFLSYVLCMKRQ
jgi:hypothetical protein